MNITPWSKRGRLEEGGPLEAFRRQIDRVFEDFFPDWPLARAGGEGLGFAPRLDVSETDGEVVVTVELPGVEEKEVQVSLSGGLLVISGEKKSERHEKDKSWQVAERSWGGFSRTVNLGSAVDADRASATFRNGVLTVKVPKAAEDRPHRIKVQGS